MIALPPGSEFAERSFLFLSASGLMILSSILVPVPGVGKVFLGAGAGLLLLALVGIGAFLHERIGILRAGLLARHLLRAETRPAIVTDADGHVVLANPAAARFPGMAKGLSVVDVVCETFDLRPHTLDTLMSQAVTSGAGTLSIGLGARGLRVDVKRIGAARLLWRLEQRGSFAEDRHGQDSVAILSVSPEGNLISANVLAQELLGDLPATLRDLTGEEPLQDREFFHLSGVKGRFGARLVELRRTEDWREIAVLPDEGPPPAPTSEILAEPGLLDVLPVPMLKIASDGGLIEANHEARAILSLEEGPLPPLFELVEGMGRPITDWLSDAAKGRGLLKPEIVRAVRPSQELFLQITLGRTVADGEAVLVGILNDATELKTLEAQFVQSQKMQAIGQLAGGVAHDFNNLLTAISGHCDLLLLRHDPGDPDYADLIQISQNSNRAASLVGQLLAFSRKQNLKPQALDLRDTMSDLAHLLNRLIGERIQLDVIHAPGTQMIRADRRQMEQVIVNLVVNARDAMPEGGQIAITIRAQSLATELQRDRAHVPPGDYVVIEVRDTGTGIAPEGIPKIFEPFYTTKKTGEGTGLGLSTAYGIVKQTGGFIFVDSAVGEGTVFSLYFPSYEMPRDHEPGDEAQAPASVAPASEGGVILLVEDEAPVRAFAGRALRMRGYTVLEAENAEQALSTLEDPDLKVDVFVTDVIMPGLDGPTWVRRALKDRPETRTVFVSGYSEEGRAEKQSRIPNSVFLPKPFSLHQLTNVVNEQFR